MKLSEIHAHTVATSIEVLGETVKMRIRPSVYTPEWESKISASTDPATLANLLAEILVEIDITETDDDGLEQPIKCDGPTLHRLLPTSVFLECFRAIGEEIRPGKVTGATSESG